MDRVKQGPDGSWRWSCPVDKDDHRRSGRRGLWGVLFVCVFVFIVFFLVTRGTDAAEDIRIPLLTAGVILVIALPLLYLWNSAGSPHEQYVMTEDHVRSGYGKEAVYSEFKKTKKLTAAGNCIELSGANKMNRVFVPAEDMDLVLEFILARLPEDAEVRDLRKTG